MSFNDRCGEAAEILERGGHLPTDGPFREWVIEALRDGKDGVRFPDRDAVRAILDHPENVDLLADAWDGDTPGGDA